MRFDFDGRWGPAGAVYWPEGCGGVIRIGGREVDEGGGVYLNASVGWLLEESRTAMCLFTRRREVVGRGRIACSMVQCS